MKMSGRMDGGADFEKVRAWDEKHPEASIGKYDLTTEENKKLAQENSGAASAKAAVSDDNTEEGR